MTKGTRRKSSHETLRAETEVEGAAKVAPAGPGARTKRTSLVPNLEQALLGGPARSRFAFANRRGDPERPIKVWYSLPEGLSPTSPVVFVLPGLERSGLPYIETWAPHADAAGALLLVPEFSRKSFVGSAGYNLGNMFTKDGTPVPRSKWSFLVVEHLFDEVRRVTASARQGYRIYGHSAGGQFVERLVLFVPEARVEMAIVANAGWHTVPRYEEPFPYGLGNTNLPPEMLRRTLETNLCLLVGEGDCDPDHTTLRRTSGAMGQGRHRVERARFMYAMAEKAAAGLGAELRWTLRVCPGVGHSHREIAAVAARLLLSDHPVRSPVATTSPSRSPRPIRQDGARPLQFFERIRKEVDIEALLAEIARQPEMWSRDTSRQTKLRVQRETNSIPIRSLKSSEIGDGERRDVHGSRYTSIASSFPAFVAFLETIGEERDGQLSRARIVRLPPGKRIYRHIDRGEYYKPRDRYHLVLESADGSYMAAGDEEVRMRAGELWWFDNKQPHEAANDSDQDRIHLIFDLLPNPRELASG